VPSGASDVNLGHDPKGSHYNWFEIICNSVVRGFSLVPGGASSISAISEVFHPQIFVVA